MSRKSQKRATDISRIIITFALIITLILPNFFLPDVAKAATNFKDINKHWAESYIKKAAEKGLVLGFDDGTFKPDEPVTRAEFTAMVNRLLKNNTSSSMSFSDVNSNHWFYKDVSKAIAASYVGGYNDGTFRPEKGTSRQEAALMLSRFLPVAGMVGNVSDFVDSSKIDNWAREAVAKVHAKGYLNGYPDGAFHPKDNITRAMLAKILCDISDNENIIYSDTSVTSNDTTLVNKIFSNNVDIKSSLNNGNATLSNVVILGSLNVYGGGDKSIKINDSRIANATIKKSGSPVRVLLSSHSVLVNADVSEKAILETMYLSGGVFGKGFQNVNIERNAKVALRGEFDQVNLNGNNAELSVESGIVTNLETSYSATGSTIKVASKARIDKANTNAKVAFTGDGIINELNAMVSGITYAKKPNYIHTSNGAKNPTQDLSSDFEVEVSPKDKETHVGVNENIVLTFKDRIVNSNNKELSKSDVQDAVKIRKNSASGTVIDFYVNISNSKSKVTLSPKRSLEKDTKYYIEIKDKMLRYEDGDKIREQITYFYTGKNNKEGDAYFYPKDGEKNVGRKINPTITFDDPIEFYNGKDITSSRLKDYIQFRKNNSNGSKVSFSVSIDKKRKEITIKPDNKLDDDQKYYLEFDGSDFRFSKNSDTVRGGSVTWSVSETNSIPTVRIDPSNNSTNVSTTKEIEIAFDKKVYKDSKQNSLDDDYISSNISIKLLENKDSVSYKIRRAKSNPTVLILTPKNNLLAGKEYEITVEPSFYDEDKNTNNRKISKFTVEGIKIDTKALDNALSIAREAREKTEVNTTADNVEEGKYFVSQATMDALKAAILEAEKPEHRTSETASLKAATALQAALLTFDQAKTKGVRPNVSELSSEIQKAEQTLSTTLESSNNGISIPDGNFWVTKDDKDELTRQITLAKAYRDKPTAESTVKAEVEKLKSAILDFERAKKPGKSGLTVKIVEAGLLNDSAVSSSSNGTDISTSKNWVSEQIKTALENAISEAEQERDKEDSTSTSVSDAIKKLEEAMKVFIPQPGTKSD